MQCRTTLSAAIAPRRYCRGLVALLLLFLLLLLPLLLPLSLLSLFLSLPVAFTMSFLRFLVSTCAELFARQHEGRGAVQTTTTIFLLTQSQRHSHSTPARCPWRGMTHRKKKKNRRGRERGSLWCRRLAAACVSWPRIRSRLCVALPPPDPLLPRLALPCPAVT